ncbi:MAG: tetrahydrofolate dehydrogenase/cyclohydrolase catalytic domain-containing protein, partial [Nitrososphaerales archaeon]
MKATLMDGKSLAEEIKSHIRDEVNLMYEKGINPSLATVLVGDDQASRVYLRAKHKACVEVGIQSRNIEVPESVSPREFSKIVTDLNGDKTIHGILVQMPLPEHIDSYTAICSILPDKDVDGLHPNNLGSIS